MHLNTASFSSLKVLLPQIGHFFGGVISLLTLFDFFITLITWGITSPALWISTVSPIWIFFFLISSKLCRVAFEIITPPKLILCNLATGVIDPVLPTWKSMSSIIV